MNVALSAMFQNATKYLDRYVAQFYSLCAAAPEHTFEPIFMEGDGTDQGATWDRLNREFPGHVFKREHGGKIYGPVDVTQRWLQIAYVMDGIFERVRPEHDALLHVESDLIWQPATLLKLLSYLEQVDAAVPMIWMKGTFYDTFGYRKDNVRFTPHPPYHSILTKPPNGKLYDLDSGGGCVAIRGEVARKCRCRPPTLALIGFYNDMKVNGYTIGLDRTLDVVHPPVP